MTTRFYPRQQKSRIDALIGPGHINGHDPRNERSQRDGLVLNLAGEIPYSAPVAVTGAGSLGVKSVVAGGSALLFTVSGADLWQPMTTNIASAITAGINSVIFTNSVIATLATSAMVPYSVDITRTKLNIVLPAIAAYSPGASSAIPWTFPEAAFKNRAGSITVASAIVVTSAA